MAALNGNFSNLSLAISNFKLPLPFRNSETKYDTTNNKYTTDDSDGTVTVATDAAPTVNLRTNFCELAGAVGAVEPSSSLWLILSL